MRWFGLLVVAALIFSGSIVQAATPDYGLNVLGGRRTVGTVDEPGVWTWTDGDRSTGGHVPWSEQEARNKGVFWEIPQGFTACRITVYFRPDFGQGVVTVKVGDVPRSFQGQGDGRLDVTLPDVWADQVIMWGDAWLQELQVWQRSPTGGCIALELPQGEEGEGQCPDPWRRDPRTGYCFDWWSRLWPNPSDRGLSANPSGVSWDGGTVQWVGIPNVDYYAVEYSPEDTTVGDGRWPKVVAGCDAIPGSWTDGAVMGCAVIDKEHLAGRRWTARVTAWRDGVVVADSIFSVHGATHVELGYYTWYRIYDWFGIHGDRNTPAMQQLENSMERMANWGPFGAAKQASNAMQNTMAAIEAADKPTAAQVAQERFRFPLCNSYTGDCFYLMLPLEQVLASDGWTMVWRVISAGMWLAFAHWLIKRLAPRLVT